MPDIADRIKSLIKKYYPCSDSDNYLLACFWRDELRSKDLLTPEIERFLSMLARDEVTAPESIRRSRQSIQQLNEEYRGKKYNQRHERADKVKEAVKSGGLLDMFESRVKS